MLADARLSAETVRAEAAKYDDWDPESVVRIAWRESNFVPTAFADDSDDLSYGLMQINMKPGTADIPRLRQMFGITRNEELFNPVVNIRAAHVLYLAAGKTFIPWNIVPPVANYPTSGGATSVPGGDEQGNPQQPNVDIDENGTKDIYIADWGANDASNWHTWLVAAGKPSFDGKVFNPSDSFLQSANFGIMPGSDEQMTSSMKGTFNKVKSGITRQLSIVETVTTGVEAGIDQIAPWADALGKLLSFLTSLSFWKKVGVGVIALLAILLAFGIYNKESVMPIITKGAVNG